MFGVPDYMRMRTLAIMLLSLAGLVGPAFAQEDFGAAKVAVISIHGTIDYGLQKSLERRVEEAIAGGAEVILFEMDSYGGGLQPGAEMGDYINDIKKRDDGRIRTVAYVHKKAISAGALISLACQEIIMRSDTSIGDCEAIMVDPQTRSMKTAPEKVQSMVRNLMRRYAQSNGYPVNLCEAMVDVDIEVWRVTLAGEDEARYLTPLEMDKLTEVQKADMTKDLVVAESKLLTLTASDAMTNDISSATVSGLSEAVERYAGPGAEATRYDTNWSEELVRFLNSMPVASMLMLVGMVSLYMAFKTPGFGVPEITAIACFAILFLSKYLVGLATTVEVMIFAVGIALLAIEIFLIPGFGVVGLAGVVCILASLVLALQKFTIPKYAFEVEILVRNMLLVFGSTVAATFVFMTVVRFMPNLPFLSKLVLATSETVESGYVVGSAEQRDLVGRMGVALGNLRPSGRAEFGDNVMIVVADGEFIDAGERVVIVKVRGNRIVVNKA